MQAKSRGRPTSIPDAVNLHIRLSPPDHTHALELGHGSVSQGIRTALKQSMDANGANTRGSNQTHPIHLSDDDFRVATQLGFGSMARGIRRALSIVSGRGDPDSAYLVAPTTVTPLAAPATPTTSQTTPAPQPTPQPPTPSLSGPTVAKPTPIPKSQQRPPVKAKAAALGLTTMSEEEFEAMGWEDAVLRNPDRPSDPKPIDMGGGLVFQPTPRYVDPDDVPEFPELPRSTPDSIAMLWPRIYKACEPEWKDVDAFLHDVTTGKPDDPFAELVRPNKDKPWGPDNFSWAC
jgi:hypothetical protein